MGGISEEPLIPAVEALRQAGADRFDPVRFRFIESLALRAQQQRPAVASLLEARARAALAAYRQDCANGAEASSPIKPRPTDAGRELRQLVGEISRCRSLRDAGESLSFEDELRAMERQLVESRVGNQVPPEPSRENTPGYAAELGVMRHMRDAMAKRQAHKRVMQAIQEKPDNPGPLNPQALIIRSLSMMQDLSPAYASRFVSYMDALLCLRQSAGSATSASTKGGGRRKF